MKPSELYERIEDGELITLCFQTCREHLASLATSEIANFQVYAISAGVFLCSTVPSGDDASIQQGVNVVLRLDKLNPLKSTLITQPKSVEVISAYEFHQNGLGPKLLSVFKNGRIEEWIDGRPVGNRLRDDKEMQKLVAQCIAKINAIDSVPAERNGNFLFEKVGVFLKLIYKSSSVDCYRRLLNFVNSNLNIDSRAESSNAEEPNAEPTNTDRPNADSCKSDNETNRDKIIGLENELNFLRDGLVKLDGSLELVFSHNDLSQENIFQRLDSLNQIYVLSYDLAGYNFRGYDLAHFLNNIAFDLDEPPTDLKQLRWITDSELSEFLAPYLSRLTELRGEQTVDLIKEVKFFRLFSSYLSILVSFLTILTSEPIESNLAFLKLRIEVYLKLKADLVGCYPEFLDH